VRTSLTRALVAVLAPAVLLGIANLTPADAAPSTSTTTSSGAGHAAARDLLDRVSAAFASPLASRSIAGSDATGTTPAAGREVTLLLRDLGAALPSLTPGERATAQRYLARPTDPGGETFEPKISLTQTATSSTTHFLIHYTTSGTNAAATSTTDPNKVTVAKVATVLEDVYKAEVTNRGFRKPLSDSGTASALNTGNPNSKIDVFLANTGKYGIYGYVTSDDDRSRTVAPYMVLDNNFSQSEFRAAPINSLKVTVAHEFFHGVQYAYDATEAPWFLEGTAVWMEDQVYPRINDYLQYLKDSQIPRPGLPVNTNEDDPYAAVIFWKFLSERFRDTGIIRDIFNRAAVSAGSRNGRQAVASEMLARNTSFSIQFGNYASWNTLPAGSYADRGIFPVSFGRWFTKTLGRTAPTTGLGIVHIDHLASSNFVLKPGSTLRSTSRVKVTVNGPSRVHVPTARVQVRYRSGSVTTYKVALNSAGDGALTVPFGDGKVTSVVVTLTNASAADNRQAFRVRSTITY